MRSNFDANVIKYYDKCLQKYVVIDRKTGFSSYQSVDEFSQQNQNIDEKQFFRKLSESQTIIETKTKSITTVSNTIPNQQKEEINQKLDYNNQYKSDSIDGCPEQQIVGTQNSTNIKTNNEVLEGFGLRAHMKINSSVKLDKILLSNGSLRVIGQMDRKFIVCLAVERRLMLAFDQHAVHERIRYETLLNQIYDKNGDIISIQVLPPIDITVDCHQLDTSFDSYQTQIKSIVGIELKKRSVNRNHNNRYCVTQIPDCLSDSLDVESIKAIIKEVIIIIIGDNTNERPNLSAVRKLTPKLLERMQTKACRGAIRFGDSLKLNDCLKLICSLSKCDSPFRCAHGRALVAPLAYLPNSTTQNTISHRISH